MDVSPHARLPGQALTLAGRLVPNRFCVQPMEGADAGPDGAPGALTLRRYRRFAAGGFGLIWMEATQPGPPCRRGRMGLALHEGSAGGFEALLRNIRAAAVARTGQAPCVVLQLACEGADALSRTDDASLSRMPETLADAARLAREIGFDGVDIKACHQAVACGLLTAFERPGRYGGGYANRTRWLREALACVRAAVPDILLAVRLSVYDPVRHPCGIGRNPVDPARPTDEPLRLVRDMAALGIHLLNISTDAVDDDARFGGPPASAGAAALHSALALTGRLQAAAPGVAVVAGGLSRLGPDLVARAAAILAEGQAALIGLGRAALAYPDLPYAVRVEGAIDVQRICLRCGACSWLIREGAATGCVLRDAGVYAEAYRQRRRFQPAALIEEARRCRRCDPAPCTAACPAGVDVPGFVGAFADGDSDASYAILRRANVLPEMCSHLCPVWMQCEGACVEAALTGHPIRIRAIQYQVASAARAAGRIGLHVPAAADGGTVAVVGGGPAGLACAAVLIEKGHRVTLFERERYLGGTPRLLIPERRLPDVGPEIDALLAPALAAGRLVPRMEQEMGRNLAWSALRGAFDAVVLAAGLWRETSLGGGQGVVEAQTFLREVKAGVCADVPPRVAVLAGDDGAMDAALAALEMGARDVYVIFGGPRSALLWHHDERWFARDGAHALMLTRPLGYVRDARGRLTGVRVGRVAPRGEGPDAAEAGEPARADGVIAVDLVIEALGLWPAAW